VGIALDVVSGWMYWADYLGGDIQRAHLDGTGQETVINALSTPLQIALDLAGGKIYWADGDRTVIGRANLDGTGQQTLVHGLKRPLGIALDVSGGLMYWADAGAGQIGRANLDGTGRQTLVSGLPDPRSLTLDLGGGKIYWADYNEGGLGDIQRANLDGTGQETLVTGLNLPVGITLDLIHGQMYWSENGGGKIERANLDGSGQATFLQGLKSPAFIALDISVPVPQPIVLTGYSADVISDKDPSTRFAQPFHGGMFAWFEAGAVDDNGTAHNDGLPAGLTFVSATGSGATYQIQPANATNVLQLGAGQTGTLTLATPAVCSRLYVIASSGDGTPSSVGSGTINFADGSMQAFNYNSFDWCNGSGGLHPEAVLPGPNGRADVGPNGTAFVYNQDCDFQVYETVIPIDASHANVAIASIDFTGAPDAFWSNTFGVSGK
jgi:hypothetical protein